MSELINVARLEPHFAELLRRAATDLPVDVEGALDAARADEQTSPAVRAELDLHLAAARRARETGTPLCSDAAIPHFWVRYPAGPNERAVTTALHAATLAATQRGLLPSSVLDLFSGHDDGKNLGEGLPQLHLRQWDRPVVKVDVLVACTACDAAGSQRALLDPGADLGGVRRAAVEMVRGALRGPRRPALVGVAVGGDRVGGTLVAREQLLRHVTDHAPDPRVAALEVELLRECRALEGAASVAPLLAVKVSARHRLARHCVVTVACECWACRRHSVEVDVLSNTATFGGDTFVAAEFERVRRALGR